MISFSFLHLKRRETKVQRHIYRRHDCKKQHMATDPQQKEKKRVIDGIGDTRGDGAM